ncbi:hypothetical protein SAMN04488072_10598 [Lentibacillus halodurans]|uniref:Uncharacterized protein n=1 Tax=Lentibacillus halodurans TaxID=237679 RepID=A0A1I0XKP6_9BACI|nr:hypothetical protein SAMN04488072_10598 [Lentibacillus halodurans]
MAKRHKKLQNYQIGSVILREYGEFHIDMFKHYGMHPKRSFAGCYLPCVRDARDENESMAGGLAGNVTVIQKMCT